MTVVDVAEHYEAVRSREIAALEEHRGEKIPGGEISFSRLILFAAELNPIAPRPGLMVLEYLLPDSFSDNTVAADVRKFVASTILPLSGIPAPDNVFPGHTISAPSGNAACEKAEAAFTSALEQARYRDSQPHGRISVYHDGYGRPLAFRKHEEESTALTLVGTSFGEAILPAGTIASISSCHATQTGREVAGDCIYATYQVDDALDIRPLRISSVAYDMPLDRALFSLTGARDKDSDDPLSGYDFDEARAEAEMEYSLDDFREVAARAMTLCGVKILEPSLT